MVQLVRVFFYYLFILCKHRVHSIIISKSIFIIFHWSQMESYLHSWQALAKTLSFMQLAYLRQQFHLLGPNKNGFISLQNFKTVSSPRSLSQFSSTTMFEIFLLTIGITWAGFDESFNRCNERIGGDRIRPYGNTHEGYIWDLLPYAIHVW